MCCRSAAEFRANSGNRWPSRIPRFPRPCRHTARTPCPRRCRLGSRSILPRRCTRSTLPGYRRGCRPRRRNRRTGRSPYRTHCIFGSRCILRRPCMRLPDRGHRGSSFPRPSGPRSRTGRRTRLTRYRSGERSSRRRPYKRWTGQERRVAWGRRRRKGSRKDRSRCPPSCRPDLRRTRPSRRTQSSGRGCMPWPRSLRRCHRP